MIVARAMPVDSIPHCCVVWTTHPYDSQNLQRFNCKTRDPTLTPSLAILSSAATHRWCPLTSLDNSLAQSISRLSVRTPCNCGISRPRRIAMEGLVRTQSQDPQHARLGCRVKPRTMTFAASTLLNTPESSRAADLSQAL